jgi:hypothetical protein
MEDIFDKNDDIGRFVREEGLLKTSPDFTARVMNMVNASPQKARIAYKPLLSKAAWTMIILGLAALAVISPFAVTSEKVTDISLFNRFKPVLDFVNGFHFSFKMAPNTLMLVTMIMASAGLLLVLDYFLNKRFSESFK